MPPDGIGLVCFSPYGIRCTPAAFHGIIWDEHDRKGMRTIKKRLVTLVITAMLICTLAPAASAAKTGAAGSYYYTDIVTTLWGVPINAINIGGRTLIDAESLAHYGFSVTWLPEQRTLKLQDNITQTADEMAASGALLDMAAGKPGTAAGRYYHTDIVTTLNGLVIESYNIGGRTFISAEGMRAFGYTVDWDGTGRTLTISAVSGVKMPWGYSILLNLDSDATDELDFFYRISESLAVPYSGGGGSRGGYPAMTEVTLTRDRLGKLALTFGFYRKTVKRLSPSLASKLTEAVSFKNGSSIKDPKTVEEALNALLQVYVDGIQIQLSALHCAENGGNPVYTLALDTDIDLEENGVFSVALLCNVPDDALLTLPPVTLGMTPYEVSLMNIRRNYGETFWEDETDLCTVICRVQRGVPHFGTAYILTIVYKADGRTVELLPKLDLPPSPPNTFNAPSVYGFSMSGDEQTLSFSCDLNGVTYHFQAELATGTVTRVS
jgi:hypothetical protein